MLHNVWVIEHQKRGLPHIHILIILADKRKTMFAREVDKLTCVELPPSPHELGITEEDKKRQTLWDIVVTNMIHGPCGKDFPTTVRCMKDGKCGEKIPKGFC